MFNARWMTLAALVLSTAATTQAQAPNIIEQHADLPGVRLFYIDTGGTGVPVVLMHAATGSVRAWEHQIPAFTKAGFRVISFDRRGWGRTESAPGAAPGTAADDLIALMDHLHIDRFHLVGTAAGGFVTFDTALSFPKRLRSLVVANETPDRRTLLLTFGSRSPIHRDARRVARGVAVVSGRQPRGHAPVGRARTPQPPARPRRLRSRSRTASPSRFSKPSRCRRCC
jgi:pimeloyl-ACP methyl ester carboxylesterase